jgi:hypothetical protein
MMKPPAWAEYEIDRYLASIIHGMDPPLRRPAKPETGLESAPLPTTNLAENVNLY